MQIIDVSIPTNLVAVGTATDDSLGGGFPELYNPFGVATFTIGSSVYAIAVGHPTAAPSSGGTVQIIDVSIPSNPLPEGSATDGTDGFNVLAGARGVATFTIHGSVYAIVASQNDNGVPDRVATCHTSVLTTYYLLLLLLTTYYLLLTNQVCRSSTARTLAAHRR